MDPQFDTWRKLLALKQANPTKGALRAALSGAGMVVFEDEPWSGYYRLAHRKGGPLEAVAIWRDDDGLNVMWGAEEARLEKVWPHAAWQPVPYEWYEAKLDGKDWPDVHQIAASDEPIDGIEEMIGRAPQKAKEGCCEECVMGAPVYVPCNKPATKIVDVNRPGSSEGPYRMCDACADHSVRNRGMRLVGPYVAGVPGPGHNSGASVDELTLLRDQLDELKRGVKQYAKIASDEQRSQSQDLRSALLALSRSAKAHREGLIQPHKDAIEAINAKWKPVQDGAQDAANAIRSAQEAYGTEKLRAQEAERARVAEENRRREQEQLEEAQAAQAAVDRGEAPPEPSFPLAPVQPEPPRVAPQTTFKGGTGRAAHERAVTVITKVTDWPALFTYFHEDQDARAYMRRRADSILKSTGEIPPGCETGLASKVA